MEETPVSFDNLVLSNDSGESDWSTRQGSGVDREGPVGPPGVETGRRREGEPSGVVGGQGAPAPGPRVVPFADLSRQPSPISNLDQLLQRNYPEEAREQGVEGRVRVLIQILPTGRARILRTVSSSRQDFATACRRTVGQARFDPPLDSSGQPVATQVPFECDFRIRY